MWSERDSVFSSITPEFERRELVGEGRDHLLKAPRYSNGGQPTLSKDTAEMTENPSNE